MPDWCVELDTYCEPDPKCECCQNCHVLRNERRQAAQDDMEREDFCYDGF